jgi:hypothetical protein
MELTKKIQMKITKRMSLNHLKKEEVKMSWYHSIFPSFMSDHAKVMTPQIKLIQTMKNGPHMMTGDINLQITVT